MRTIIIDDIPLAVESLKADLKDYHTEDVKLVGVAHSVMEGAKLIRKVNPDLIFLDVHMNDGDGFDLLEMIDSSNISVVFTTASADHAIKAFQFSAVDYLLKPIDPELLSLSIKKAKQQYNVISDSQDGFITVNTNEEIRRINKTDIIRLEAMGNYTQIFLTGGDKVLITKTLKDFVLKLGLGFLRVHQSHLVNLEQVHSYIKTEGGYLKMKDDSNVPVSVRKKQEVINAIS